MTDFKKILGDYYSERSSYSIVEDEQEVRKLLESDSATTWGAGPIGDTGWYKLAESSPSKLGQKPTILICKRFESIILQAYWFGEGEFWNLSADGYVTDDGPDNPENLEIDPNFLKLGPEEHDEVMEQMRLLAPLYTDQVRRCVAINLEGSEQETFPAQ